ncbi:transcriptional regulator, ArsR family [Archaeoglobus sulfaticallidus PM70-1]|uniref:Transcriptional regulator, ArsR family n=1 Tax=Archaeoglobus sulfaticallidus PM70-1 TaxID=387631 RepID=N0BIN7_9EURY|nr:metalloregulator ArsR/SmtB family transcription factor [Archaeoglobus sulfaticallidus]AGK60336.1 transcriptional regulator, ArsR family [Archaeoglobus sulfaticallidus PM70-1]
MGKSKKAPVCKDESIGEYIEVVASSLPPDERIIELSEFLEAFGDSSRIKILLTLSKRELCTCDISAITGLSVSAVSHQLRILRDKKLVKYRREGRNVYYSLDDEHVAAILDTALEHIEEGSGRK